MNFKEIHIGNIIHDIVKIRNIDSSRLVKFFNVSYEDILKIYSKETISTELLLRWSKLLEYDFFRLYSQHLILYSPSTSINSKQKVSDEKLPIFRKNIYTKEIIDFILEQITSGVKTKNQVINEYNIPKTTLYKWISKNQK